MDALTLTPDSGFVLLGVLGIYVFAGFVKGAMGFGLPAVAIAVLPFLIPVETALALNVVVIIVTNLQQIRQSRALRGGFAAAWPMMIGIVITVPLGALFLNSVETRFLMAILGAFILLFVALSFLNPSLRIARGRERVTGFAMGLISGFVGALTSAPGAIFVSYVVALGLSRPTYMGALGFIMALFGLVTTIAYAGVGLLRAEHLLIGVLCIPPAILGMRLGDTWAQKLPLETFRRIVLLLLACLALIMIRKSIL